MINSVTAAFQLAASAAAPDGLAALIAAAARDNPGRVLFEDDRSVTTAAQAAHRVAALAEQLRSGGLRIGEHVVVVVGAHVEAVVAIAATLSAGLTPVLAACHLGPVDLAGIARAASAAALIGPCRYGDLEFGETFLSTAALAEKIRGVLTYGEPPLDGAVDVSMPVLDAMPAPGASAEPDRGTRSDSTIVTVAAPRSGSPRLVPHDARALAAAAQSVLDVLPREPCGPILSLLAPATFAALVAAPFAALISGRRLVLHGPFDALRLLAACDRSSSFVLLSPARAAAALVASGLTRQAAALLNVTRSEQVALPAISLEAGCPVLVLEAYGERSIRVARGTVSHDDDAERWRSDQNSDGPGLRDETSR